MTFQLILMFVLLIISSFMDWTHDQHNESAAIDVEMLSLINEDASLWDFYWPQ